MACTIAQQHACSRLRAAASVQTCSVSTEVVGCKCSTGWITHWGEPMANTSAAVMIRTLDQILSYGNDTGSVNLYMAYGGSICPGC